jgi:hypothetical protein
MQDPMEGVSMLYTFAAPDAPGRHETQYFEMFGNRGIYHKGWSAVTKHRTPWQTTGEVGIAFDDDVWELYDGSRDWTQARDLSKEYPDKLHELQRLFLIEATRYRVLPLDDRSFERVLPEISGKPELITRNTQVLLPGMGGLTELHVLNTRNRSWSLTAQLGIPQAAPAGCCSSSAGRSAAGRSTSRTASRRSVTTSSASTAPTSGPTIPSRPESASCGSSSPTTVAASARAATSPSTSTVTR